MKSFNELRNELQEAHQVVATTKDGETFKSGVYPTKEKALAMHYKMSKSGNYKKIDTVKVQEEVELDEEGTPTGIKLYHTDKDGKESHTVVFTPRDAQQREKEVKKAGGKTTHRAVMYGKKEGERVAVKEETDLAEIEEGVIQRSGTDKVTEDDQEYQDGIPVRKPAPAKRKDSYEDGIPHKVPRSKSVAEGSVPADRNRPAVSVKDKGTLGKVAALMAKEKAKKKEDLPFTPDKPHKPVATAGKYGLGYSTARHLARQGMKDVQKEETSNDGWYKTGKEAKHIKTGETTYEYEKYKDGKGTGERHYRNAAGKVMGEEVDLDEDLGSLAAAAALGSAAAYGIGHLAGKMMNKFDKKYDGSDRTSKKPLKKSTSEKLTKEETEMSQMDKYLAAISGNADFRTSLEEKTLTPAELKKREEIAQAIERENPGMDKSKKMAIATAQAKKVAEEALDEKLDAEGNPIPVTTGHFADKKYTDKGLPKPYPALKNIKTGKVRPHPADVKEEAVEEQTEPKTEKEKKLAALAEPKDKITHADVLAGRGVKKEELSSKEKMKRGMYNKEGVELKTFSQLMAELDEAKKDDYWDFKDLKDEPKTTTRKIAGTRYGGSAQKDEPEDNDEDDKPTEKRGRGRPAGSKSGARH